MSCHLVSSLTRRVLLQCQHKTTLQCARQSIYSFHTRCQGMNEHHGAVAAAAELQTQVVALLSNVALCVDGEDIITPNTQPLTTQITQYFDLPQHRATAVEAVLDHCMNAYAEQLVEQLAAATEAGECVVDSGSLNKEEEAEQELESEAEFRAWTHTTRRCHKLLAKATYLRQQGAALSPPQLSYLATGSQLISEYLATQHARLSSTPCTPVEAAIPEYLPLYCETSIHTTLDAVAAAMGGLDLDARAQLFMTLARQMVLFAPSSRSALLSAAADLRCGASTLPQPAGGSNTAAPQPYILRAFDLDSALRFGSGTFLVRRVFDSDHIAQCRQHIEELGKRQDRGVVHFVANPDDIPSRRRWDCLQNDTVERHFLAQLRHPVVVAINATVLGSQWRVGSMAINETVPGSVGQEPHIGTSCAVRLVAGYNPLTVPPIRTADYTKWRKYGPFFTEFPRGEGGLESESLQGTVAFEPFTVEAGATGIVPGSQHWETYPATAAQVAEYEANEVIATMAPGDYLVFNPNCQHRGRGNTTPHATRKAGVYQFVMGGLQPMEVPGPRVAGLMDGDSAPHSFDDAFLHLVHSYPYPDDLAGKAGQAVNAEGAASKARTA